jgi:hypothetical protein
MSIEPNQLQTHDAQVSIENNEVAVTTPEDSAVADAPIDQGGSPAPRQSEEPREDKPQPWQDDRRKEIFARAREKRLTEVTDYNDDPNGAALNYGAESDKNELGDLERQALDQQQRHLNSTYGQEPAQQQAQQPTPAAKKPLNGLAPELLNTPIPIKIDGQISEVPLEELLRSYQIEKATDRRLAQLAEAKSLLANTNREIQRGGQPPAEYGSASEQDFDQNPADAPLAGQHGNTSQPPQDIAKLVEEIQLGSPEVAAQALQRFVTSVAASQERPAPVDPMSEFDALQDRQSIRAVQNFMEANPQIGTNPAIQFEATREIHRGMAEDLINAGYTVEDLSQIAPDTKALSALHKKARIANMPGVRPVDQLLAAGYQAAVGNLRGALMPSQPQQAAQQQKPQNPAVSLANRQERKDRLQNQPAARRLSPGFSSGQAQARSVDQARADAVANMRKLRGQPV